LDDYAACLSPEQYQKVHWPNQNDPRDVYVHVVRTRVRKPYTCQLVIARYSLTCPLKAVRYWASSDLDADLPTLVNHIATRWDVEILFSDAKGLLGLDHYQLMDANAIIHFWTLIMTAYVFNAGTGFISSFRPVSRLRNCTLFSSRDSKVQR